MSVRTFRHENGRLIRVSDGTRTAGLVEADANYSEVKPTDTSEKEADSGSGDAGGRGSGPRKGTQRRRGGKASELSE